MKNSIKRARLFGLAGIVGSICLTSNLSYSQDISQSEIDTLKEKVSDYMDDYTNSEPGLEKKDLEEVCEEEVRGFKLNSDKYVAFPRGEFKLNNNQYTTPVIFTEDKRAYALIPVDLSSNKGLIVSSPEDEQKERIIVSSDMLFNKKITKEDLGRKKVLDVLLNYKDRNMGSAIIGKNLYMVFVDNQPVYLNENSNTKLETLPLCFVPLEKDHTIKIRQDKTSLDGHFMRLVKIQEYMEK